MSKEEGYVLPDPPTPEEHAEASEPATASAEEVARRAKSEQTLAELQMPTRVITAFVVFLTEDGSWLANSNLVGTKIEQTPQGQINIKSVGKMPPVEYMELHRPATLQDIVHAAAEFGPDAERILGIQMTAQQVVGVLQQQAQAQQAQMQGQAILERLGRGPGGIRGRGLTGPNGSPL